MRGKKIDVRLDMDRFTMEKLGGEGDIEEGLRPPHDECGSPVAKLGTWQKP